MSNSVGLVGDNVADLIMSKRQLLVKYFIVLTLIRVASQPTLKEWLVGILIPTDVGLLIPTTVL